MRVLSALRETYILAAMRDALLPRLISGEIRVRDIEKAVDKTVDVQVEGAWQQKNILLVASVTPRCPILFIVK